MLKFSKLFVLINVCAVGLMAQNQVVDMPAGKLTRRNFLSRDPFILAWEKNQTYYLYKSSSYKDAEGKSHPCFAYLKSKDLENWEGPFPAFIPPQGFWATKDFWAPEVHEYKGKFYLFGSMYSDKHKRGTQIMRADTPEGPFVPISEFPQTPAEWMCLDGTLWVEDGKPYMVFCHEWLDFRTGPKGLGGTIDAIPLTDDLSAAAGESFMLFRGSDAPWNTARTNQTYVTDGPFLFKENGELYMLWSTGGWAGYTTLIAHSTSGKLAGPWEQLNETINASDGGHAMRFKTFDGKVMTAYHGPNSGATRVVLIEGPIMGNDIIRVKKVR
ncbi:MAG: family 43 glycosylhydrolase [Victivallales bacterium]|nr:family 43 glycosylhydrolase [Victivallales bacterium]